MKLECPIFTSTSPRELFLPITIRLCRTKYSKSLASMRAIASPRSSGLHWIFEGLAGADFNDNKAQASLSAVCTVCTDMMICLYSAPDRQNTHKNSHNVVYLQIATINVGVNCTSAAPPCIFCCPIRFHNSLVGAYFAVDRKVSKHVKIKCLSKICFVASPIVKRGNCTYDT